MYLITILWVTLKWIPDHWQSLASWFLTRFYSKSTTVNIYLQIILFIRLKFSLYISTDSTQQHRNDKKQIICPSQMTSDFLWLNYGSKASENLSNEKGIPFRHKWAAVTCWEHKRIKCLFFLMCIFWHFRFLSITHAIKSRRGVIKFVIWR